MNENIKERINDIVKKNEVCLFMKGIKVYSDWPTIPQLYIKNEFIGGCDIVKEMFEKGELQTKLEEKKITYKK